MDWNENLYHLWKEQGGELFCWGIGQPGYEGYAAPDGVLVLSHRGQMAIVCAAAEDATTATGATVKLWTRVLLRVELPRPCHIELKREGLLGRSAGKLQGLTRKEDDFAARDWRPEGYTVSGNETAARAVLADTRLRRLLEQCRQKDPVALPVQITVSPVRGMEGLHLVETRTDRFPVSWTGLWQWGRSNLAVSIEQNEKESLQMLTRLLETGKAAYDAVRDAVH